MPHIKPRFHSQIYNSGDIEDIFPILYGDALDSGTAEKIVIPIP
jgi:hypothetical protein